MDGYVEISKAACRLAAELPSSTLQIVSRLIHDAPTLAAAKARTVELPQPDHRQLAAGFIDLCLASVPHAAPQEAAMMTADQRQQHLADTHRVFLEACRHREQEFLRYFVILIAAVGLFLLGFKEGSGPLVNLGGMAVISVICSLVLLFGAYYSIVLGYNYRYLTLAVAKIEWALGVRRFVPEGWQVEPEQYRERAKFSHAHPRLSRRWPFSRWKDRGYLDPPEVIRAFYLGCLVGLLILSLITVILPILLHSCGWWNWLVYPVTGATEIGMCVFGLRFPLSVGGKYLGLCEKETTPLWIELAKQMESKPDSPSPSQS